MLITSIPARELVEILQRDRYLGRHAGFENSSRADGGKSPALSFGKGSG